MAIIDSLKDALGNIIYPKTLTKAVYDADTEKKTEQYNRGAKYGTYFAFGT